MNSKYPLNLSIICEEYTNFMGHKNMLIAKLFNLYYNINHFQPARGQLNLQKC